MTLILISLILIGLIFPILGCIVAWKKYVYFADGLSHASFLAAAISIVLSIPIIYAGIIITLIFVMMFVQLKGASNNTALISLISNFMLAVALIITYTNPSSVNLGNLLFGDILSVTTEEVVLLFVIFISAVIFIYLYYDKIILISLNRNTAKIHGINVDRIELIFLILLALSIFSAVKIVGSLLVNSLIVIPAMAARLVSTNPFMMIITAIIIGLLCNIFSFAISLNFDLPITPLIIISNVVIYFICLIKNTRYSEIR